MGDKKGCSFAKRDWGIKTWPTLNITEAGNRRRAKETASKRKNQLLGAQEKVIGRSKRVQKKKAVVSSPGVVNAGRTQKTREVFAGVVITKPRRQTRTRIPAPTCNPAPTSDSVPAADFDLAPGPAPTPVPGPSPAPAPSPGPSSAPIAANDGMVHCVLLQDINAFEDVLNNPSSSRSDLKLKAAELRVISFREKKDVEGLSRYVNKRAEILDRLAEKLSNAGSSEEDDDMEEEEEDEEDEGQEDEGDDDAEQDADTGEEQAEEVGGK